MLAVDSIPDSSLRIKGKGLQEFLVDCFMSKPTRFPLILITGFNTLHYYFSVYNVIILKPYSSSKKFNLKETFHKNTKRKFEEFANTNAYINFSDEKDTPVLYRAVSYRFKRYFNAARIVKPTLDDYTALGMEDSFFDTPLLFVLLPEVKDKGSKATTQDMGFSAVMFETKKMGDLNYPNILRFLFGVNNSYRHILPGENQSNDQEVAEMLDIVRLESKRFEIEEPHPIPKTENDDNSVKFTMTKTTHGDVHDEL